MRFDALLAGIALQELIFHGQHIGTLSKLELIELLGMILEIGKTGRS
jgi:hypothetical protein